MSSVQLAIVEAVDRDGEEWTVAFIEDPRYPEKFEIARIRQNKKHPEYLKTWVVWLNSMMELLYGQRLNVSRDDYGILQVDAPAEDDENSSIDKLLDEMMKG
jgi:hypothetical protein